MDIDINPVLYWLNRESRQTYDESVEGALECFRRAAKWYLKVASPEGSPESDTRALIYFALRSLQDKILDQYLPALHPNQTRGVNTIWPNWRQLGVRVELPDGRIDRIGQPLPSDGTKEQREFADGRKYSFTFYDSGTKEQRHRWFFHVLQETSRKKGWGQPEGTLEWEDPVPTGPLEPDFVEKYSTQQLLAGIRGIMDSSDYNLLTTKQTGPTPAERKRKSRAMRRAVTAAEIILQSHVNPRARAVRDQLRATPDGKRHTILDRYRLPD